MNKILVLLAALAFATPLAAAAQPVPENNQVGQKVQQTYHTNFSAAQAAEAGQGG